MCLLFRHNTAVISVFLYSISTRLRATKTTVLASFWYTYDINTFIFRQNTETTRRLAG